VDITPLQDELAAALAELAYCKRDRFAVRLALEEALVNAIKHGHGGDECKVVRVWWRVGPAEVVVSVEDEGAGFDPDAVPDPLDPANLEKATGRGLLLMRSQMTALRFNERGNSVTMRRRRSPGW
jgi:serine/threonine-protein kinase RsbW